MRAVSPSEENQEIRGTALEEEFQRVFGETTREVVEREREREIGEEAVRARGRQRQLRVRGKWRSTIWTTLFSGVGAPTA